jgi:hypothetical protein
MILTREKYDAIAKGEPHVVRVISKLAKGRVGEVRTSKGNKREIDSFTKRTFEKTGEIMEQERFAERASKCPHPIGTTTNMRFREKKDGPVKGLLTLIVTDVQPDGPEHWIVRWERVTQHRPVPIQRGNVFLARGGNYTGSASQSIDREAPVIETGNIRKLMADDLEGRREIQRRTAEKEESKIEDIDETADYLRELLSEDEAA